MKVESARGKEFPRVVVAQVPTFTVWLSKQRNEPSSVGLHAPPFVRLPRLCALLADRSG